MKSPGISLFIFVGLVTSRVVDDNFVGASLAANEGFAARAAKYCIHSTGFPPTCGS